MKRKNGLFLSKYMKHFVQSLKERVMFLSKTKLVTSFLTLVYTGPGGKLGLFPHTPLPIG
jgi:hypothetical protein